MAGKKRNSSFEILTAMQDLNTPAGALQLAQILHLPSASIGRELLELEKAGLLVKVQNKGRIPGRRRANAFWKKNGHAGRR